jgi:hypothetical protein
MSVALEHPRLVESVHGPPLRLAVDTKVVKAALPYLFLNPAR